MLHDRKSRSVRELEIHVRYEAVIRDLHLRYTAQELKLQAAEYERRLEVLNHAHAEAQRVLGTYITRDVYERDIKERDDKIRKLEDEANKRSGQYTVWAILLTIGLAVGGVAARMLG